jgi:hypothetical protein
MFPYVNHLIAYADTGRLQDQIARAAIFFSVVFTRGSEYCERMRKSNLYASSAAFQRGSSGAS